MISSTPFQLEDLTLTLDAGAGSPTPSPALLWIQRDLKLSPQDVTVNNHKAKSFFVVFCRVGAGFKNLCLGWISFVRTRVLTADPSAGLQDWTRRGS